MNPVALRDADGIVYAYACGGCHHVAIMGWYMRKYSPKDIAESAKMSETAAAKCCACSSCGTYVDRDEKPLLSEQGGVCDACWPKVKAERDALYAAADASHQKWVDVQEVSLQKAKDYEAAKLLREKMSWISEEGWCAGWLVDLEYVLWPMVENQGDRGFGRGGVTEADVAALKKLSNEAGGWWTYNVFVTFEEWKALWDEFQKKQDREGSET